MGIEIKAAAIAATLGSFAGGAIADAGLEGAVVGIVPAAAAGLAALLIRPSLRRTRGKVVITV